MSYTAIAKPLLILAQLILTLLSFLQITGFLWPPQATVKDGNCFDYIIIGSGAGSVVASRLTEDADISVLMIEAGDRPSVNSILPGLFVTLQNSNVDWQYKSEKELTTQSQSGEKFKIAVGKVLGGSSSISHLVFLRGDPSDFNSWAATTNDESWSYEEVLPYFKKSEHINDKEIMNSSYATFHSIEGPTVITREPHEEAEKYLKSFEESGKKRSLDLNGKDTIGYTQPTVQIGNLVRQSTAEAYIRPIKDRKNLYISYNTRATKINFDKNNNAVSVNVIINNKKIKINAAKEIILCAGVFNSPQLLMLSGIGPKEHLESLKIPVIQDLPVGENLQDHVAVQLVHKMEVSAEVSEIPELTEIAFPVIIGAVNLNESEPGPHYQTTNLIFTHDAPYLALTCFQIFGYKNYICDELQAKSAGRNTLYSLVAAVQPKSRGSVKLRSADPTDSPIILQNFYSDKRDLDDMVKFITDFIIVSNSTYFKKVNAELVTVDFGCTGDFYDKDFIRCYAEHMSTTLYHQTSTCPMGKVLDSNLRVKGVNRLRLVDASAFPDITKANPLASVLMLAEKGADMIKRDQSKFKSGCTSKDHSIK